MSKCAKYDNIIIKTGGVKTSQDRIISNLRFPLIVLIVFFHLYEPGVKVDSPFEIYNIIATFFSADGIAKLGVPAFFLISGYLFFYNVKEWNADKYISKLKKRVRSLLIPYLLWIAIPICGGVLIRIIVAFIKGYPIVDYTTLFLDSIGWFRAFWDASEGHPYVVPLWFIRDLMVCCLLTPFIHYLIKKLRAIYITIIGICFIMEIWFDIVGFCVRACFFFSLGAYFSINGKDMFGCMRKCVVPIYILAATLLVMSTYFPETSGRYNYILCNLFIIFGIWAFSNFMATIQERWNIETPNILKKSIFFIYAFHVFPLPGIGSVLTFSKNVTKVILRDDLLITYLIEFILTPLLIVGVCLIVYSAFNRMAPRLCSIMLGMR